MITIEEIQSRQRNILDFKGERSKREKSLASKDLECFKYCVLYLESNPSGDFVSKQLKEVKKKIARSKDGFYEWARFNRKSGETDSACKARYNTVFEVKKLNTQVRYLNFILKN